MIIVNDASSDNTEQVAKDFIRDLRFSYLFNKTNIGQTASFNKAIGVARGKYIAFLDDDNTWQTESLEVLTKGLEANPDMQVAYGGRYYNGFWIEKGKTIQVEKREEPPYRLTKKGVWHYEKAGSLFRPLIDVNSLFIRKQALIDVGLWDPNLRRKVDWELTMRLVEKYEDQILRINRPLTTYNLFLGELDRQKETFVYQGYVYLKHRRNPLLKGQKWWPPEQNRARQADLYKQLADLISDEPLDRRSGREINGNMLKYPRTQKGWNALILKTIPGAKQYLT